jgi:hypothetical protein
MILSILTKLCKHHHNQYYNFFKPQKEDLDPLLVTSASIPSSLPTGSTLLCLCRHDCSGHFISIELQSTCCLWLVYFI